MVRLGARHARYFGLAKLRDQIAMIAAVANLTLLAKLGNLVAIAV